jgi:hypothetical protein
MDDLMDSPYYDYHAAQKVYINFFRRWGHEVMISLSIYRTRSDWYCVDFFSWPFATWDVSFKWRIHPS